MLVFLERALRKTHLYCPIRIKNTEDAEFTEEGKKTDKNSVSSVFSVLKFFPWLKMENTVSAGKRGINWI